MMLGEHISGGVIVFYSSVILQICFIEVLIIQHNTIFALFVYFIFMLFIILLLYTQSIDFSFDRLHFFSRI